MAAAKEKRQRAIGVIMGTKSDDAARLELLLGDIRDAFAKESEAASAHLVKELVAIDGRPWAEMGKGGKPLTQNRLARMLKPLAIAPDMTGPENRASEATNSGSSKRRSHAICRPRGFQTVQPFKMQQIRATAASEA